MTLLPPTGPTIGQHLTAYHGFTLRDAYGRPNSRLLADHDQLHRMAEVNHEHGVLQDPPDTGEIEDPDYIEEGGVTFVHATTEAGGEDHYLVLPGVCDDEEVGDALDDIFEDGAEVWIEHVERVEL